MNSLATISQANYDQFCEVVRTLDPELFLIKVALDETGINPAILPRLIRGIHNLAIGTGYGEIRILMNNRTIVSFRNEENDVINKQVMQVIDK